MHLFRASLAWADWADLRLDGRRWDKNAKWIKIFCAKNPASRQSMCHEGPTLLLTPTSEPFRLAYAFGIGSGNTGYEEKGGEDAWESFLSRSSSSSVLMSDSLSQGGRALRYNGGGRRWLPTNSFCVGRREAAPLFNFLLHYLILLLQRPLHRGRGKGKRGGMN